MATDADMNRFRSAYAVAFGGWPECWSSKGKDASLLAMINQEIAEFVDRYGIDIVVDAVRNMPWTKMGKPGLKDLYGPCTERLSRQPSRHEIGFCGFCNGYAHVLAFVDQAGKVVRNAALPRDHVAADALPTMFACPECKGFLYQKKPGLLDLVRKYSQVYAPRYGDASPVDDADVPNH